LLAWLERVSGDLGLVFAIRYDDQRIGCVRMGMTEDAVRELTSAWARLVGEFMDDPGS
jgi:hypothetical protein